jgi:hypothetical protein
MSRLARARLSLPAYRMMAALPQRNMKLKKAATTAISETQPGIRKIRSQATRPGSLLRA